MKQDQKVNEPLAIVGMACRFPKAEAPRHYWGNILNGTDCIEEIPETHWNADDYFDSDPKKPDMTYARRGGFLEKTEFYPLEYGLPPKAIEATDTSQLLGMVVAREALEDAGYGKGGKHLDRERTACILGVTGALELVIPLGARLGHPIWRKALREAGLDEEQTEQIVQKIADGYVPWQEMSFPGLLGNVAAGRIANSLDLGGTNCVSDAACASALSAVHLAALELWAGRADMVLTGGIDTFNDIFMYMCFSKTPALSPTGNSRPFDAAGDGTILGEGLGIIALKRLSDAERDGDRIYCVLRGLGSSSDGKGNAIYAPSAKGQMRALKRAYSTSGVTADTIELVEGHGTGTKVGDAIELSALQEVYRGQDAKPGYTALGSVKSQIGHTKAAAGIAGLMKAALALENKVLPPSIKVDQPLEALSDQDSPFYFSAGSRPWMPRKEHKRRAAVSAFGFGGSNFHAVLEEHKADKDHVDWDGQVQIAAFSADDRTGIQNQVRGFDGDLSWKKLRIACARGLQAFNPKAACRLLFVLERGKTDPCRIRDNALALLGKYADRKTWSSPEGIFYGEGEAPGKLGILFPGQGAQYVGMLRDLACRFPQMQRVLADVDRAFADTEDFGNGDRLSDLIFPLPAFDETTREEQSTRLRSTQNAQPAIGAVSIGALKVLNHFGVTPQAAAGHSYGEVTALCASERFDAEALYLLSRLRGKLMAEGEGDRGAMLAVRAPVPRVEELVTANKLDLVLANKNAPDQVVLSGSTREIERAAGVLKENRVQCKRLPVAAAFHSTLVAQASEPFRMQLREVAFPKNQIPVYSNTTAQPYPENAEEARELLATQLTKPVEFVKEIKNMVDDGVYTFLEVGPGARLTGLVKSILKDGDYEALAVDASSGKRNGAYDLAKVLAQLVALGYRADIALWEDSKRVTEAADVKHKGPAVEVNGANMMNPETKERAQRKLQPVVKKQAPAPAPVQKAPTPPAQVQPAPVQSTAAPTPVSVPATVGGNLPDALRLTQQHMAALQKLQEETAKLHLKFLEGQELAQQNMRALMEQQRAMLSGAPMPVSSIPAPTPAPAPQPVAVQPQPEPVETAPEPIAQTQAVPQPADNVGEELLTIVADKTGYPADMLEMGMSLDADLGIDSIKRVEILSALQEAMPNLPAVEPDRMGELQTLADIVAYLREKAGTAEPAPASPAPVANDDALTETLLAIVADKTGYPADMLETGMSLDADLGIDSIKRVEILSGLQEAMPQLPAVEPDRMGELQTLADIIAYLDAGAPTPSVTTTQAPSVAGDLVQEQLMEVVADKTGYPVDMLEPGMSLDADLGIDSIKRVEILSALQEAVPNLPAVEPDRMGQLQTLADIVAYLTAGTPLSSPVPAETSVTTPIAPVLLNIVADKTGYPEDMLELSMALEEDLGIDSIKRVEILSALQESIPGLPEVSPDRMAEIRTIEQIVAFFEDQQPVPVAVTQPDSAPEPVVEEGDIVRSVLVKEAYTSTGEPLELAKYPLWVVDDNSPQTLALIEQLRIKGLDARGIDPTALDVDATKLKLAGLIIPAPQQGDRDRFLEQALLTVQLAGPALRASGGLLATVSYLDGAFGLDGLDENATPEDGALAGLLKTASHEWPEVTCRALDAAPGTDPAAIAAELLTTGPLELGIDGNQRLVLTLTEQQVTSAGTAPVAQGDLIVITGGARGVTAEAALSMARAWQPTLLLLGRSAMPEESEPAWLVDRHTEADIKRAVLQNSTESMTPRQVGDACRRILAEREIRENLARMRAAGANPVYRSVDLRDADSVGAVVSEARAQFGPVRGLVHGAGVLADRLIVDKTAEQFQKVYGTKVVGLRNLLRCAGGDLLFAAFFSSSTGRFGRKGQVDYAMANEVLNKTAQQLAGTKPGCRVVSVNWGPWKGGMVTPELEKVFQSEGVGLIPLRKGADYLVEELSTPAGPREVVILGESDIPQPVEEKPAEPAMELLPAFDLTLSLDEFPFLRDHVMRGKTVAPMAVMVEWLAHAALVTNPGFRFGGFNDLRVFKGIVYEGSPVALNLFSGEFRNTDAGFTATAALRINGRDHARAEIMLTDMPLPADETRLHRPGGYGMSRDRAYELLFHGPQLQGITNLDGLSEQGVTAEVKPAPAPAEWVKNPLRGNWLGEPMALDCAFQMMILWCREHRDKASLPMSAGCYRQFRAFPPEGCRVTAQITGETGNTVRADMEFQDRNGNLLARLTDYECIMDANLAEGFKQNRLPANALHS
ncbi:MAG: SDR family NAD(P)-dependent oxidoreductase [Acidobacteriota bacterium]|nr:SDR family NAD(P)-dependent oxidoreductase [Acidobacteriota bacterium]